LRRFSPVWFHRKIIELHEEASVRSQPRRVKARNGHKIAWAGLCAATLLLIAPGGTAYGAALDLASLVRKPAALILILSSLWIVVKSRLWSSRLAALFAVAFAGWAIAPGASPPPGECAAGAPILRIAWINAMHPPSADPIASWIADEMPQVVGIAELDASSHELRKVLTRRYPHWASCLPNGRCSTLLYARQHPSAIWPLARRDPENRKSLSAVQMHVRSDSPNGEYHIFAVHLSRALPLGRQAQELAKLEAAMIDPANTVIMGDLNMAPTMRILGDFAARNGLQIVKTEGPTWPLRIGTWGTPGLWQIDHLLIGQNWKLKSIRLSPDLGSDHCGYVADLCRKR